MTTVAQALSKRPATDPCVCGHVAGHHLGIYIHDPTNCRFGKCPCPKFIAAPVPPPGAAGAVTTE